MLCRCTDCGGDQPHHSTDCEYMNEAFAEEAKEAKRHMKRMKAQCLFFKTLGTATLLVVFGGVLFTIGKIMFMTDYATVAPLPLTFLMAVVVPAIIIWGLAVAIRLIWSSK